MEKRVKGVAAPALSKARLYRFSRGLLHFRLSKQATVPSRSDESGENFHERPSHPRSSHHTAEG